MTTVLVTGASSGIGLASVEAIAAHGDVHVVATVRRDDDAAMVGERQSILGHPVSTDLLDLRDEHQIDDVVGRHRPTVVVNVAGDVAFGPALEAEDRQIGDLLDEHLLGPLRLARAAVPHMRAIGEGRIVNVGSALARTTIPRTGWYAAAKSALATLTESLRIELADDGIAVVLVELGAVDTPAWDDPTAEDGSAGRRWAATARLVRPLFPGPVSAARAVADAATVPSPRARYRAGFGGGLLSLTGRLPRAMRDRGLELVFGSAA
jgi:NAD(P)-dependent dehydrogenase (short-subunit alcohol dehydrogenase family)